MPARIVGLYALSCMEREGTTYGYRVSQRIAERTEGAWRPGAGAVYPALQSLVRRGLAVKVRQGRRQVYRITPHGRLVLRRIRRGRVTRTSAPDLSSLWAEVVGIPDLGPFLLRRLRRSAEALTSFLERVPEGSTEARRFRTEAMRSLDESRARLARGRAGAHRGG